MLLKRDFACVSEQHCFKIKSKCTTLIQMAIHLDSLVSGFDLHFVCWSFFCWSFFDSIGQTFANEVPASSIDGQVSSIQPRALAASEGHFMSPHILVRSRNGLCPRARLGIKPTW